MLPFDNNNISIKDLGKQCNGPRSRALYQVMEQILMAFPDAVEADTRFTNNIKCPPGICRKTRSQLIAIRETIDCIVNHGIYRNGEAKTREQIKEMQRAIIQAGLLIRGSNRLHKLKREIKKIENRLDYLIEKDNNNIYSVYKQDGLGPYYEEELLKRLSKGKKNGKKG